MPPPPITGVGVGAPLLTALYTGLFIGSFVAAYALTPSPNHAMPSSVLQPATGDVGNWWSEWKRALGQNRCTVSRAPPPPPPPPQDCYAVGTCSVQLQPGWLKTSKLITNLVKDTTNPSKLLGTKNSITEKTKPTKTKIKGTQPSYNTDANNDTGDSGDTSRIIQQIGEEPEPQPAGAGASKAGLAMDARSKEAGYLPQTQSGLRLNR